MYLVLWDDIGLSRQRLPYLPAAALVLQASRVCLGYPLVKLRLLS